MSKLLWQTTATRQAEQFIRERNILSLPVCPFLIAQEQDIEIKPLPPNKPGVSGMLLRGGNNFGICYATYIDNEQFQRFCVGHELGHYNLPGHPERVLTKGIHTSYAGFVSKDRYELEADHFAAGILMPSYLFNVALDKAGEGLDAIISLSNLCLTSLTATAIRYAQCTPDAVAIVVSSGSQIEYCFMSDSLQEIKGLNWLRKGMPIPRFTVTHTFNKDPNNIIRVQRAEKNTNIQNWFGGSLDIEMYEEVIGLGEYGKTLTVLTTSEDIPDQEELDEEEELIESWTPRFRR